MVFEKHFDNHKSYIISKLEEVYYLTTDV